MAGLQAARPRIRNRIPIRLAALGLCLFVLAAAQAVPAAGPCPREVSVPAAGGAVRACLFKAPGEAPRPAVILLHGVSGPDRFWDVYAALAEHLSTRGTDVWIVSYYDASDAAVAQSEDREARRRLFSQRLTVWTARVRAVADAALAGRDGNGRVGVVGFSQGGYLAVACAASDARLGALVVYYGGAPDALAGNLKRLPPLLAFHGLADTVVPPAKGQALVQEAQALGGQARLVEYPGQGHGFGQATARDAGDKTAAFLRNYLVGP